MVRRCRIAETLPPARSEKERAHRARPGPRLDQTNAIDLRHRSLAVLQKYIEKTNQDQLAEEVMARRNKGRAG